MSNNESNLQREIQELRSEVRYLRRMIETGFAVVGIAVIVMWLFPQYLHLAIGVGVLATLFSATFRKREEVKHDA